MKKLFTGCLVIILVIAGGMVWWFWEDISYWWDDEAYAYYELPEDCYEDEYYDYQDKLCYIDEEYYDDDLLTLFFDLVDEVIVPLEGDFEDFDSTAENAIIIYEIDGNLIVNPQEASVSEDLLAYQADTDNHQKIWVYYANLIPPAQRTNLTQFVIFTDGAEEVMAAVEQDSNDPAKWVLAVDIVDAENPQELTYTLIHEFGHLLGLDAEQVDPDEDIFEDPYNDEIYAEAAAACLTYFPGEGCSRADSYINMFVQEFWVDLLDELEEINYIEDDDDYYAALDDFYEQYQDQFVTDYAATNPGEDIAESWTHFVLQPKPAGNTVSEEKVLFFYDFPELVELREQIVARTFSRLRRQ